MKALFLSISVLGMLAFASCSKEKTCECTVKTTGGPVAVPDTKTSGTTKEECSSLGSTTESGVYKMTTTCVEK